MNYPLRLRDEAERDITLAASWYEEQREGLGQEFLDELLATLQNIAEHPRAYPVLHRDVRRALLCRVPCANGFLAIRRQPQDTGLQAD